MRQLFHTTVFLLVMCVVLSGTATFMLYATRVSTPSVQHVAVPFDWERRVDAATDCGALRQECKLFAKMRDVHEAVERAQSKSISDIFTYGVAFAIGWGLFFGVHLAYIAWRLRKLEVSEQSAPL